MKPIHFCKINDGYYDEITDSFINPIIEFLPDATIGPEIMPGAVNVLFYLEYEHHFNIPETKVFIPHGIADKGYRNFERMNQFDYIGISGPLWYEKILKTGIADNKIFINGYTKLDPLFQGKIVKNNAAGGDENKKLVLWAPTHNNSVEGLSSYPALAETLSKLPGGYELIESIHPAHKGGKQVTLQALADADIVIADSGSTLYSAWALGKQVIFPDYLVKEAVIKYDTFESYIYREGLGLHAESEEQLLGFVECGWNWSLDREVDTFIDGIFEPGLRGTSGLVTAEFLKKIAEDG